MAMYQETNATKDETPKQNGIQQTVDIIAGELAIQTKSIDELRQVLSPFLRRNLTSEGTEKFDNSKVGNTMSHLNGTLDVYVDDIRRNTKFINELIIEIDN